MKPKLFAGLAVAAVIAVGGAVAVTSLQRAPSNEAQTGQRLFPEVAARADDLRAIVIASKDGTVRLARKGDRWIAPDKFEYAASVEQVRKLLVGLSELRTLEAKSSSPDQYGAMEVEDIGPDAKSVKVTLQDGGGAEILSVIVGKQRLGRSGTAGDGVYVRRAGTAQAWLAQGRLSVDREPVNWLDRKVVDVKRDRVREAVIRSGSEVLMVTRGAPAEANFTLAGEIPADKKIKSEWDVNAIGGAFEALELDDLRPAADIEFAAGAPAGEVVTYDGLRVSAALAEKDGATWARFVAASAPPAEGLTEEAKAKLTSAEDVAKEIAEINARVGNWAYKLPAWKVETLRKKPGDLLEPKEKDKAS